VGFRQGGSTTDQLTLLTQDTFVAKKAAAMFVNLTAAYDTMSLWPYLQVVVIAT